MLQIFYQNFGENYDLKIYLRKCIINTINKFCFFKGSNYHIGLIQNGTLYLRLLRLDRDVEYAIDKQIMNWQNTDTEYRAVSGDFLKQFSLSQNYRTTAEHEIYDAMVYV